MKPHQIAWLLLFAFHVSSIVIAGPSDQSPVKLKEVAKTDQCLNHSSHSYQVFIPSVDISCKKLPLMVVIDPHGNGKLAIQQFEEAAKTYPMVLIASNQIRNNVSGYLQLLDELISDAKSKYPVGTTIYLGGFSGGARMALDYAMSRHVNGVIACGALAEPDQIKAINCRIIAIVGMDDFNFIESARFIIHPEFIPQNLAILTTNASHSWPNIYQLKQASGYLILSSEDNKTCMDVNSMMKSYVSEQTARLNSFSKSEDVLNAMLLARNLSLSNTIDPSGSFRSRYEKLVKQELFIQQRDNLVTNLKLESILRDQYYPALHEKDSSWWRNEILVLNTKINTEKDQQKKLVYQRIKGFLGVACFSICSRSANQKEISVLKQVVPVYQLLEPENPDQLYYSAVLAHMEKNSSKEKYYFAKAKEKGYQGSLAIP
jgi:dienelactone hydrolase